MNNLIKIVKKLEQSEWVVESESFKQIKIQAHRADVIYSLFKPKPLPPTDIKYYIMHDFIGRFDDILQAEQFNKDLSEAIERSKIDNVYIYLELRKEDSFIKEYRIVTM